MLIETLQKQSGLTRGQLNWFAKTASKRYKVYPIEKRRGGTRLIAHPSRELKSIQRWINKFLLRSLPIHDSATAYKVGASIAENARRHLGSAFTLRMDFVDFFPSFSAAAVQRFLRDQDDERVIGLSDADISFVSLIVSRNGSLTIGSPSSPILTNAMMYNFDERVSKYALDRDLTYSRYADDIFISTKNPGVLLEAKIEIERLARNYEYVSLRVNRSKTAYLSKRYRRAITGVVLTTNDKISIGRGRKREIRSLVYLSLRDRLEQSDVPRLRGLLAFAMDVEPPFFLSLVKKFGEANLNRLLGRD